VTSKRYRGGRPLRGVPESRLAAVRVARGLSQEDLARFAGLTINTVRDIEHGRTRPAPSTRRALAEELEVSEEELVEG